LGRWRNYVVSKMQWQIRGRRQSSLSRHDTEEEELSEMQIQLSDIGTIRAARATETETEAKTKTQKTSVETKDKK
jgi:protein subunit release factor B